MFNYDWCDNDPTLLAFDCRKAAEVDDAKLYQLAEFLHPTPPRRYDFTAAQMQQHPLQQDSWFELAGPSLANIAPRLLAGSKPGSSGGGSTGATPLPPYKTVICRSYHTKGKCFRAEPEKCWFVHELSEMRNFSGSSDTASFNQDHRAHSPPQPRRNFQISVGAGEKGKAPATPPPPVPVMQISPQQLVQTGKKPASADPRLYKTEMCRFYEATGMCRFGNACTFAHGVDELRRRRDERTDLANQVDAYFTAM